MLYLILKFLSRYTLKSYFRRIRITGKERVPENVPCIFIANHPSAFMDPIVVATTIKTPIYFIAAGEYVGKGIKGWIFRKWLHMIPVFRPSTRPEDVHKNKKMFDYCFDHLRMGSSLLIFPEGVSVTERKIKPFKTGVARIARGAEIRNNLSLDVHIVPIGLNYSNPHQFRSDLYVNIGKPIRVTDFITPNDANEVREVESLTELAERALLQTTLHIEIASDDDLLEKLNGIYSRDIKDQLGIEFSEQEREFAVQKTMLEAINYFREKSPARFSEAVAAINHYHHQLVAAGLYDKDIRELKKQATFRRVISYTLGLPFFLIGCVGNILPYYLVQFILKRLRVGETFQGSMVLAAGLALFLIYYVTTSILVGSLTPVSWWAFLLPLVLYTTGIYALLYLAAIRYSRQRRNLRSTLKSNRDLINQLTLERARLIEFLEKFRLEFEQKSA